MIPPESPPPAPISHGSGLYMLPFLAKDETERRTMYNATGPLWDGNEVWLITAGGVKPGTLARLFLLDLAENRGRPALALGLSHPEDGFRIACAEQRPCALG